MINPEKTFEELVAAGLPCVGVDALGNVQFSRALTPTEQATAAAILAGETEAGLSIRQRALHDARLLAQTINGVAFTSLTATQTRNLVILLAAIQGWAAWNGTDWIVNVQQPAGPLNISG